MAELPSGTVTFLFTDLEGSTRLWEEHPEAMRPALARHDEILRDAISDHDGSIVKTTGDGVHAAFSDAAGAVRAALDAQRAFNTQSWGETGPLLVRMGIHTGPVEQRDGDYYGTAVNRAARLMSVAHGGQILVSLVTEQLARDSLSADTELRDLGDHELRDLVRPERVFQVVHDSLRGEFPPLRTATIMRSNLPTQITSFVGRGAEVDQIDALLSESPLVTLIGVGGVGKTRLAVHAAAAAADRFSDGVWFCDLAPVSESESIALTIATTIGMAQRSDVSVTQALLDLLTIKHTLLVLDNCEHLVDEVGRLADRIVRLCPHVHLLVTTREALAIDGERLWPVRPLTLPDEADPAESAAVQLFADRVAALRPGFALDESNTASVIDICRRLDGIPLAIELAAARARSLSPRDIADRLDRRFALLSGGRRGGVARHETLRAAVDWSYELLDHPERVVLNRVSVFAGGFTVRAAEAVADDGLLDDLVLDVLTRLADKSLFVVDDDGRTRYRMLETIRQYALAKLDDSGETAASRDRHLAFFVSFAEQAGPGLFSSEELAWEDRVESELENLRTAVAWAVQVADATAALRIATSFSNQGFVRHSWGLAAFAEAALAIPGADAHELAPLARVMHAHLFLDRGEYDTAVDLATEVLQAIGADDHLVRARAEGLLGDVALRDARDDPVEHFERAMEAATLASAPNEALFYREFAVIGSPNRGMAYIDAAVAEAEAILPLAYRTGCPTLIANAEFPLGYMLTLRGDDRAIEHLTLGVESRSGMHQMGGLPMIAVYHAIHGSPAESLQVLDRAMRMARGTGDRAMVVTAIDVAMQVLALRGAAWAALVLVSAMESGALPSVGRSGVPGERRAQIVARCEQTLTPEERTEAHSKGQAMSYDEVVEFLLERISTIRVALVSEVSSG